MPPTTQSIQSSTERETTLLSPRFIHWVAFLFFSIVTLASSVQLAGQVDVPSQKYAVACSAITFTVTALVVVMHLFPTCSLYIVGTVVEGALCVILFFFWSATVAIISNSSDGLAVDQSNGAVTNGNLYYFSWAGFACSIMLGISFLHSVCYIDVARKIRSRSSRLMYWAALLAACLVVMGSSASAFHNKCPLQGTRYCRRAILGIVLGCIGVANSIVVMAMTIESLIAPFLFEAGSVLVLFVGYIFAVAYITANDGPGSALGNLYYSTWAAFLLTFLIGSSCFKDYQVAKAIISQQENEVDDPYQTNHAAVDPIDAI